MHYLCNRYEEVYNLDHSYRHGILVPGPALPSDLLFGGDGKNEERAVRC